MTWYDGALLVYVCLYVDLGIVADIHYIAAMQTRLRRVTRYDACTSATQGIAMQTRLRRHQHWCRHACDVVTRDADMLAPSLAAMQTRLRRVTRYDAGTSATQGIAMQTRLRRHQHWCRHAYDVVTRDADLLAPSLAAMQTRLRRVTRYDAGTSSTQGIAMQTRRRRHQH